jgi:hypothetical protein
MNCLPLRGGSYGRIAQCCGSVTRMLFGADHGIRSFGFRLVLPCRTSAIHGGDYFSLRPISSLRNRVRTGRSSKFLGFRVIAPASIAPPSQQPKIISLISIAVCDNGSISIHIGRQQGL